MTDRTRRRLLFAALLVALAARLPGIFWGDNFPEKWQGHHPDEWAHVVIAEHLINPSEPTRWSVHPYPKGMAAAVTVPVVLNGALHGNAKERPEPRVIVKIGRLVSLLYGVATVLLLVALTDRFVKDRRIGVAAAGFLALGGLHVTQSHFFVADSAGIFLLLLTLLFLDRDLNSGNGEGSEGLRWAAFAAGAGFGMKLVVAALPSLCLIAVARGPRLRRSLHAAVFFVAGFVVINLGAYGPHDFIRTLVRGSGDPYQFDRVKGAILHLVELPRLVGFPMLILGCAGTLMLARRVLGSTDGRKVGRVILVLVLPVVVHGALLLVQLDHFPRHLVPFIPWIAISAGAGLIRLCDALRGRGIPAWVPCAAVFGYTAAFVWDGERVFLDDPRNAAARWLAGNVEDGSDYWWKRHKGVERWNHVRFPEDGRPPILVIEMLDANHYLSGVDFRDSYPKDHRLVHDSISQERVDQMQALFRGTSEYREVARFTEGYFMPERLLVGRISGDRSHTYVSEIVIFSKE